MIWDGKPKFDYQTIKRVTLPTGRVYDINDEKLPSVTTILSATKSEESRAKLAAWRQREGEKKADQIRDDAAARGTIMHRILEGYVKGEGHMDLTDLGVEAGNMAQNIKKPLALIKTPIVKSKCIAKITPNIKRTYPLNNVNNLKNISSLPFYKLSSD